ncbi:cytochrome b5-like heme/steroid binding domain-containing protein, partial [Lasiosphaeria miniovina]
PPAPGLMAPPPRPPTLRSQPQPPAGSPFLSPAPGRLLPPSKQVVLQPGHSPLDWARITGPGANLRGLPNNCPYLRVTPSMLRRQTGRKGTDAWTVLGGRVYNISPYVPFHPGGGPELLRGAGKDGTQLFGEIHPWVNYEGMLSACLIGLYVPEEPPKDDEGD